MSQRTRPVTTVMMAILAALALGGCRAEPSPPPQPLTYTSAENGFSLTFPGDWRSWEGGYGTALEIMPPGQTDPNIFRDIVLVSIETLPDPLTPEEYLGIKAAKGARAMADYAELERSTVALNGRPAGRLVYSCTVNGESVHSIAYFLVKRNRGYTLLASAALQRLPLRKAEFETIASSFTLPN